MHMTNDVSILYRHENVILIYLQILIFFQAKLSNLIDRLHHKISEIEEKQNQIIEMLQTDSMRGGDVCGAPMLNVPPSDFDLNVEDCHTYLVNWKKMETFEELHMFVQKIEAYSEDQQTNEYAVSLFTWCFFE